MTPTSRPSGRAAEVGLLAELKRRNVIRMAGLYLVGAWLLVQVAGTVQAPGAALPEAALLINATSLGMTGQPPLEIDRQFRGLRLDLLAFLRTPRGKPAGASAA